MANTNRAEILNLIENTANKRHIPADDFMRFAYIESGGSFNPHLSRGPKGAKGLFQFVPDTAKEYGIAGRELDAAANTDAAARLYLHNRTALINAHNKSHHSYLSGKPEPDGLDMYVAHQQGPAGYQSIQAAMATGTFARSDTRPHILNNISKDDAKTFTGHTKTELAKLSDKELASAYNHYWQAKFDHISIPEKNIAPIHPGQQQKQQEIHPTESTKQHASEQQKPQQSPQVQAVGDGIALTAAYELTKQNSHVRYHMHKGPNDPLSGKDVKQGCIDCSGWVSYLQNATMAEINKKAGKEVFDLKKEKFNDGAAEIVAKSEKLGGGLLTGKQISRDSLKEGMIIGEHNPGSSHPGRGPHKIDHITMVVRDPKSGELMISQSRGGKGVELSTIDSYLAYKQGKGVKMYASDPLIKARELLHDKQPNQEHAAPQKPAEQTKTTQATTDALLHSGSKGADVEQLQNQLKQLGMRDAQGKEIKPDGDFGPRTKAALEAFQQQQGLKVDGIANPDTLKKLQEAIKQPQIDKQQTPVLEPKVQALQGKMNADLKPQLNQLGVAAKPAEAISATTVCACSCKGIDADNITRIHINTAQNKVVVIASGDVFVSVDAVQASRQNPVEQYTQANQAQQDRQATQQSQETHQQQNIQQQQTVSGPAR